MPMQRNYQQTVGRVRVDRPYPEWWPKRHDFSGKREKVVVGLGRIVALYDRSSALYLIHYYIRFLHF